VAQSYDKLCVPSITLRIGIEICYDVIIFFIFIFLLVFYHKDRERKRPTIFYFMLMSRGLLYRIQKIKTSGRKVLNFMYLCVCVCFNLSFLMTVLNKISKATTIYEVAFL